MFKNEADFKKVVRRLNVDTEPNQAHRENLRRQMLSAYNKSEQKSHKQTTPLGVLRRTIVRNPITKMATAAILIVAVCIGMHYLGGSIDVASVAWSQVVEQISNHTKYKCRQRVVR